MPLWSTLCALLLLLDGVAGLDVTPVATAEELQKSCGDGLEHLVLTEHMVFDEALAQPADDEQEYGYALRIYNTFSITGRCMNPPDAAQFPAADLDSWEPGTCVLQFHNMSALKLFQIQGGLLWLNNVHIVMAAVKPGTATRRWAIREYTATAVDLYLTRVTMEATEGGADTDLALQWGGSVLASEVNVLNFGDSRFSPVWFYTHLNATKTVSILDSKFEGNSVFQQDECIADSRYCSAAVMFGGLDLRLERCTFANNEGSTMHDILMIGTVTLYSDSPVRYELQADINATTRGLSKTSSSLASAPPGRFLSLDNAEFVDRRTSVEAAMLEIWPDVAPGPAPTPEPVAPAPGDEPPTPPPPKLTPDGGEGGVSTGIIAGSIGAVLAALVVVGGGFFVVRRRRRSRPPPGPPTKPGNGPGEDPYLPLADPGPGLRDKPVHEMVTMTEFLGDETLSVGTRTATHTPYVGVASVGLVSTAESNGSRRDSVPAITKTYASSNASGRQRTGPAMELAPTVQVLDDALDLMYERKHLLADRWEVLDTMHRRVGGQGVVQFIKDAVSGEELVAKFFLDVTVYQREAELYKRNAVREMMAAVVDMRSNTDCAIRAPDGTVMPPFIVLERGRSLNEWAQITSPDYVTSLQVLVQIVQRLRALHACRMVHRDIKPANILWRTHVGTWTLIDFGCAVPTGRETSVACSVPYASPEVAQAMKEQKTKIRADTSADIWALGVVIFELLTGERAFPLTYTAADIINALTTPDIPLPWEAGSPHADRIKKLGMVRKIVKCALSRDPTKRPTAEQLYTTLNGFFYQATTMVQTQSSAASE